MKITDEVKERINQLALANGGRITPNEVVADAKKKDSPLHDYFEWDIKKAAAESWVIRARELIRSVTVIVTTETTVIRAPALLRDPEMHGSDQGYRTIGSIKGDADMARVAVVNEFVRASAALRRAHEVAAALEITSQIEDLIRGIENVKQLVSQPERVDS